MEQTFSHYWMTNVYCNGMESTLYECLHAGWMKHTCKKNEPVYLTCSRSPFINEYRFDKVSMAVSYNTYAGTLRVSKHI